MQLKEIMTREVEVVRPDATLKEAADKMKRLDIGPLPVCDGERIIGMLTDRDITVRATSEGRDPRTTRVRDVMTEKVFYCFDDQSIEEAAEIMEHAQIRRLPIVDRAKRLVGIVSLGDLAVDTGEEALKAEVLEAVSQPAQPRR